MKAAVLHPPDHTLRIEDAVPPTPGPGQVLLKVRACGVCRTDLHIVDGELPAIRSSLIPGHQIVGDILEGATAEMPVGSRVGVSWVGGVDGTCPYCELGAENLCDAPTFTGYNTDGGYAECAV
ncbi:MAG TPA: alcohol dehydrogenase catalytic domain-containing protein, partial [Bryobacteraceae bacterium]|nr:alcohol dehydrogenase catalytic domain-containing protein [Bryobacteraceae bacterium]